MPSLRVAVDVGGTFTDVCIVDEDTRDVRVTKVPSTPDDPMRAVVDGVKRGEIDLSTVALFSHGTTVATNALITRRFPKAAMVTTKTAYLVISSKTKIPRHQKYLPANSCSKNKYRPSSRHSASASKKSSKCALA